MIKLKSLIEVKKPNPRLGLCYELCGKYVLRNPNMILVHGRLKNPFKKGFNEIDHAWIEDGEEVYDPVMDKRWDKSVYEGLFSVEIHKKYGFRELCQMLDKEQNWGPWEE